mgnify:CR=1 FL=1
MELALLGAISTVFGMVITYFTFMRGRDKTIRHDAEESAKVSTKLDHISRGVDDIRIDLKSNEKQINNVAERVTRVEESAKQAHLRINKLEGNE